VNRDSRANTDSFSVQSYSGHNFVVFWVSRHVFVLVAFPQGGDFVWNRVWVGSICFDASTTGFVRRRWQSSVCVLENFSCSHRISQVRRIKIINIHSATYLERFSVFIWSICRMYVCIIYLIQGKYTFVVISGWIETRFFCLYSPRKTLNVKLRGI